MGQVLAILLKFPTNNFFSEVKTKLFLHQVTWVKVALFFSFISYEYYFYIFFRFVRYLEIYVCFSLAQFLSSNLQVVYRLRIVGLYTYLKGYAFPPELRFDY